MKYALLAVSVLLNYLTNAQKWVDTSYSIHIEKDSIYGSSIDFAGNTRQLHLDIAYPTNDTPPRCGRPLVLVIYGGAWMSGSKDDAEVQRLMTEFAKRGYVAVAPNYRLGMYQTENDKNCYVSTLFDIPWNCLNIQDTAEWYRAYYRAVQDVKGAMRYMINRQETYTINVNNIFTTGFSAGGFTALGVAFLDDSTEWPSSIAGDLGTAKKPNARYDLGCVRKYNWDTTLASVNLSRPSLGNLEGSLNTPVISKYRIKGVGNLYGGMFINLFKEGDQNASVYGFHQPNDLIVPYQPRRKVFHGLNACAYSLCNQGIINRPFVYSSPIIRDWAKSEGIEFQFDSTRNTTDCLGQIADPSKGGHQLDAWSRTENMAKFFASKIDTSDCITVSVNTVSVPSIRIFPNPANSTVTISGVKNVKALKFFDIQGNKVLQLASPSILKHINISQLSNGFYFLIIESIEHISIHQIRIQH